MNFNEIDKIITNENITLDSLNDYLYQKIEKELVNIIKEQGITLPNIHNKSIYIDGRLFNILPQDEKLIVNVTTNDNNPPRQAGIRRLWLFMNEFIRVDICYIDNNEHREVNEVSINDIDKSCLYDIYKYTKEIFNKQ